jgi:hypothetical protein
MHKVCAAAGEVLARLPLELTYDTSGPLEVNMRDILQLATTAPCQHCCWCSRNVLPPVPDRPDIMQRRALRPGH